MSTCTRNGSIHGSLRCCSCRGGNADRVGVLIIGVFGDGDAIASRKEGVEFTDERGMALKEVRNSFDDARRIDTGQCEQKFELEASNPLTLDP